MTGIQESGVWRVIMLNHIHFPFIFHRWQWNTIVPPQQSHGDCAAAGQEKVFKTYLGLLWLSRRTGKLATLSAALHKAWQCCEKGKKSTFCFSPVLGKPQMNRAPKSMGGLETALKQSGRPVNSFLLSEQTDSILVKCTRNYKVAGTKQIGVGGCKGSQLGIYQKLTGTAKERLLMLEKQLFPWGSDLEQLHTQTQATFNLDQLSLNRRQDLCVLKTPSLLVPSGALWSCIYHPVSQKAMHQDVWAGVTALSILATILIWKWNGTAAEQ